MRLEFRNLSRLYGRDVALREVDVTWNEGQVVGLVGANGSGKSALLRLANGSLRPIKGSVFLDGRLVRRGALGWPS